MKFRPCIDIHNGKIKQIVGGWIKETKQMKILFRYMTEAFMVNYTESTVYPEAISSY